MPKIPKPQLTPQTQEKKILRDLLRGRRITPIQALKRYGCFRLGARIFNLRKLGHPICTNLIDVEGKRVAQYHLKTCITS